ncbi:hypothetical protein GCM10027343_11990 [Noviherbaspirillum agri]
MNRHDDADINWLTGEFLAYAEEWEGNPQSFSWNKLKSLAEKGATAYNEGSGPSFHALALDGVAHGELHFRFLEYSLLSGFDPFKLTRSGTGSVPGPVINHEDLAEASLANAWSERMRDLLFGEARKRFEVRNTADGSNDAVSAEARRIIEACAPSIPLDLLKRMSPGMVSAHPTRVVRQPVNAVEGYLSSAEVVAENGATPS